MATTNKLIFKEQVQKHVLDCLSTDYTEKPYEQLKIVVDEFKNWYCAYEQKRTPNKYEAFKEFMLGLPSCFNIEYEYYKISQTMKTWFEACGEVYKEPKNESDLYYHLVTREFATLCKKLDIAF